MKHHPLNKTRSITLWFVIVMLINNMLNIHDKGVSAYDDHNDVQSFIELALIMVNANNEIADLDDEDSGSVNLLNNWVCNSLYNLKFITTSEKVIYAYSAEDYQSLKLKVSPPPPRIQCV